jgi:predicted nuclease with RNAse H fold
MRVSVPGVPRSAIAVGIDVAEEHNGLDLVALDGRKVCESAGKLSVGDAARMVNDLHPKIVCIDSPSSWARAGKSRLAERVVHRCKIGIFFTPSDPAGNPFYGWIETGIELYRALLPSYPLYRGGSPVDTVAEVFPNACSVLLHGALRPIGMTKNAFRRGVLSSHRVEATKDELRNLHRVDAALAALTGVLALEGTYTSVGDQDEGVILLPVKDLPQLPLKLSDAPASNTPPQSKRATTSARMTACLCECGCGATVRNRFLPGHDAKLKSRLMRDCRAGDEEACERLRQLGWM